MGIPRYLLGHNGQEECPTAISELNAPHKLRAGRGSVLLLPSSARVGVFPCQTDWFLWHLWHEEMPGGNGVTGSALAAAFSRSDNASQCSHVALGLSYGLLGIWLCFE